MSARTTLFMLMKLGFTAAKQQVTTNFDFGSQMKTEQAMEERPNLISRVEKSIKESSTMSYVIEVLKDQESQQAKWVMFCIFCSALYLLDKKRALVVAKQGSETQSTKTTELRESINEGIEKIRNSRFIKEDQYMYVEKVMTHLDVLGPTGGAIVCGMAAAIGAKKVWGSLFVKNSQMKEPTNEELEDAFKSTSKDVEGLSELVEKMNKPIVVADLPENKLVHKLGDDTVTCFLKLPEGINAYDLSISVNKTHGYLTVTTKAVDDSLKCVAKFPHATIVEDKKIRATLEHDANHKPYLQLVFKRRKWSPRTTKPTSNLFLINVIKPYQTRKRKSPSPDSSQEAEAGTPDSDLSPMDSN